MTHDEVIKWVAPGKSVQIHPECGTNRMFGACLLVITELKSFGVMGYVQGLGQDGKPGGQAYIRLPWDQIQPCVDGLAQWVIGNERQQHE